MPRYKKWVSFNTYARNKSFSTTTQKLSHLWSLHWNQVNSDLPPWNQVNLDHPDKTKSIYCLHWNQVKFDPRTDIKSISITHTTIKPISILTLKPSDFRPAYQNQVNFDYPHKNQVDFDPHAQNQVEFDQYSKTK